MPRMWHVDWNHDGRSLRISRFRHATYVACGLKCNHEYSLCTSFLVMPRMWHVDWNVYSIIPGRRSQRHATYVACGLKYHIARYLHIVFSHATYVACGLKWWPGAEREWPRKSCHVCGMWIEIMKLHLPNNVLDVMPRMWHVDWKALRAVRALAAVCHATYVACGLKSTIYRQVYHIPPCHAVTVKSPTHKNIAGLPC